MFQHGVLLGGQVVFDFQLGQQLVIEAVHHTSVPTHYPPQLK